MFWRRRRNRLTYTRPRSTSATRLPHSVALPPDRDARSGRALVAAGERVTQRDSEALRRLIQPWQNRAYGYYDTVPEIKYGAQFYSRMLAPLRLFAARIDENGEVQEIDSPSGKGEVAAVAHVERIQDPGGGRSGLLGTYGRLMFLGGEGYLTVTEDDGIEQWEILSPQELRLSPGGDYYRLRAPQLAPETIRNAPDDSFEVLKAGEAVVYRLWRRHPVYSSLADSTMQAVLEVCEELLLLSRGVRNRTRSRIASAGILLINGEVTSVSMSGEDAEENPDEDSFLRDLTEAAVAAISDESSASSVVPLIVRVDAGDDKGGLDNVMKHIQFVDPNQLVPEMGQRREAIERLAVGLDMPPEVLLGMGGVNHWCVDEQTEILTQDRGWVKQGALTVGDVVRTLNHETGLAEWQPVADIYRASVSAEPMRELESKAHSSLTTLAHRWPILRPRWADGEKIPTREWTTSEALGIPETIITAAPSADQPTKPDFADDVVELVAWFWTEGSIGSSVSIAQSHTRNPERVDRIRGCLTRLYGAASDDLYADAPAWRENIQRNDSSLGGPITVFRLNKAAAAPLLAAAPGKSVRPDFVCSLTRSQLELFIDVSCQGDGTHYRAGHLDIWQRDPSALDAYELALILSGRATSRQPAHEGGTSVRGVRAVGTRPMKAAAQATRSEIDGATDKIVAYSGVVWCPTTANGTWLARRKGRTFFTGNSGWMIDEHSWKLHGHPVAQSLVEDLTAAYYRPTLKADGIEDWQTFCIGFDPAAVINHPDRSKDAKDLHGSGVLSDQALREAAGFDDDDAPSKEERQIWLGIELRDSSVAIDGIPSVKAGGIEPSPGELLKAGEPATTDGGASSEAKKTPPEPPPAEDQPASVSAALVSRIVGASDASLHRTLELAGARLRNFAKRDQEVLKTLDGVPNSKVAVTLGPETAKKIGASSTRSLVAGARPMLEQTLRLWGIDQTIAEPLADRIEQHAARMLFQERTAPLPQSFEHYVRGLEAVAVR